MLQFNRLASGGMITNYDCSSKCKHCVYASSPCWPKDYITVDMASEIFQVLRKFQCTAVHIGGGEPLLHPTNLFPILKSAGENGIHIEYIETNASWYKDLRKTGDLLRELQKYHVNTLLVSIDPFHNEFVPFYKVKGVVEACQQFGVEVFPWLMEFWDDLEAMGDTKIHKLEEYEQFFGNDYQIQLLKRYHLNFRGRALQTYKGYLQSYSTEKILQNSGPCRELAGVHHFHIDLYGNFILQSCAGLAIHFRDLTLGVTAEKYPILYALDSIGIKGLYDLAVGSYGFIPKQHYTGKCDLCYDIRKYLVMDQKLDLSDLQPIGHYVYI